jgi:hypothetical protein
MRELDGRQFANASIDDDVCAFKLHMQPHFEPPRPVVQFVAVVVQTAPRNKSLGVNLKHTLGLPLVGLTHGRRSKLTRRTARD